ncbi:MAG: hypothetical protein ABMA13_00720 [Chthoniobacteraceae bacterium]
MNAFEEKLYEMAGHELISKAVKPGLWTKAFAMALGDEQKTKAVYIELRVAELREECVAELARQNETAAERRCREIGLIRERFGAFAGMRYLDTDHIPSSSFDGRSTDLCYPVSSAFVAEVLGLLEFEVIGLIKRRYIQGLHCNGDWFCDLGGSK